MSIIVFVLAVNIFVNAAGSWHVFIVWKHPKEFPANIVEAASSISTQTILYQVALALINLVAFCLAVRAL